MVFALVVFLVVLAVFALDWVHRTPAALLGALLVIVAGVIGQEEAVEAVNWETLGLLVGMMILIGIVKASGLFGYLAIKSAQAARGHPGLTLIYLAAITAVLSAFLDNVTTVLLMFPMTLVITQILEEDPFPFLVVEVLASNIGGTATLIGDPPNIIIGTEVNELSFVDFIVNPAPPDVVGPAVGPGLRRGARGPSCLDSSDHRAPPVVVLLRVSLGIVWLVYARKLRISESDRKGIMDLNPATQVVDRRLRAPAS